MSLKKSHVGLTFIRESDIWDKSFTERAPKLGGLIEFYRSPARVQWTPTGNNVPDYPKLAQLWWQNIGDASSGAKTPQAAMDSLAAAQDSVMERLEKSGVQGACGPKLNKKETAEYWFAKSAKDGNIAPAAQARQREAEGRNRRLRHPDQVVAGHRRRSARCELRLIYDNSDEGRERSRPFVRHCDCAATKQRRSWARILPLTPTHSAAPYRITLRSRAMRMIFRCDPALTNHLPRPVPARGTLPDWLRAMPAKAHSEIHGREIRTVKQCPPFVDAMAYGVHDPAAVRRRGRSGAFSWAWDIPEPATSGHPRAPLSFHVAAQFPGAPFASDGQAAIKFNSFWTIELEPGWSLFATHPVNRDDLPFRLISGLVDADRFHDGGINFPAIWTAAGIFRRAAKGHAGGAVLRGAARGAATACSKLSTRRTRRLTRRRSPRCWPRPASIASGFARGAASIKPPSERRSACLVQPQPAVRRRGQRHRDGAEGLTGAADRPAR